jgi:chromosome segregation ATPase
VGTLTLRRKPRLLDDQDLVAELHHIRRQLPQVVKDRAAADANVAQHSEHEAALVERGADAYLDGADPAETERDRIQFETRKEAELREQRQLQLAEERLRARGAHIAETLIRRRLDAHNEAAAQMQLERSAALTNAARLEAAIQQHHDKRFELERQLDDARAEFTGRATNWRTEDDATVRRIVEGRLKGQAGVDEPPPHLRQRVEDTVRARLAAADDPRAREAAREWHRDQMLAAGYVPWSTL